MWETYFTDLLSPKGDIPHDDRLETFCKLGSYLDRLEKLWGHNMKSQKEPACMNDENI